MQIESVEMYTIPNCTFCVKAKELLDNLGIENVTVHTLGQNDVTKQTLQEHLDSSVPDYGQVKTVPQIFVNGTHIGGYVELAEIVQT